jgi:hypothetical protein
MNWILYSCVICVHIPHPQPIFLETDSTYMCATVLDKRMGEICTREWRPYFRSAFFALLYTSLGNSGAGSDYVYNVLLQRYSQHTEPQVICHGYYLYAFVFMLISCWQQIYRVISLRCHKKKWKLCRKESAFLPVNVTYTCRRDTTFVSQHINTAFLNMWSVMRLQVVRKQT